MTTEIAKQNRTTVEKLERVNWLDQGAILKIGRRIWLEATDPPPKEVKRGWVSPRMFPQS